MVKLAPSILSADFSRLLEHVKEVEAAGVETLSEPQAETFAYNDDNDFDGDDFGGGDF